MKSDVIRKRARQEARKGSSTSGTPSASPGNSARASPVAGAAPADHSSGTMSNTYDFSASAFEFSQVTPDTTDRLTHQHEAHESGGFNSALSPGTTSYLDTLQLQYPSAHGTAPDHQPELHSFDLASSFEQAFQDDGSKRRRVSPDSDLDHALPSSSSGSVASSLLSGHSSSDQTDATSFGSHSPIFDPFNSYFPYTFNFAPTASGWAHPPMTSYNLTEEEGHDIMTGRPAPSYQSGSMDDSTSL